MKVSRNIRVLDCSHMPECLCNPTTDFAVRLEPKNIHNISQVALSSSYTEYSDFSPGTNLTEYIFSRCGSSDSRCHHFCFHSKSIIFPDSNVAIVWIKTIVRIHVFFMFCFSFCELHAKKINLEILECTFTFTAKWPGPSSKCNVNFFSFIELYYKRVCDFCTKVKHRWVVHHALNEKT